MAVKNALGLIYTSTNEVDMRDLVLVRSTAAVPVAGRYRVIDFVLSNLVNSGVHNVGIIVQRNYHSLMDHLGSGKDWDLASKRDGLFLLPPLVTHTQTGNYSSMLEALCMNLGYLRRSKQRYVLLTNSNSIYNMSYNDIMKFHVEHNADITCMYRKASRVSGREPVCFNVIEDGRIADIEVGAVSPSFANTSMELYIMERQLLCYLLDQAVARGYTDFNHDILQRNVADNSLHVYGYEYKGYVSQIESIRSYYRANMDVLKADIRTELFNGPHAIYTKVRDEVPVRYAATAKAANSLIADGCYIEGIVENSVIFRGVRIGKGTVVRNSIIMQDSEIQDGVELENVILDKQVIIKRSRRLIGHETFPIVIGKNAVI